MSDRSKGVYNKYRVERRDGSPKHANCRYFVLDLDHDPFAKAALMAYARECRADNPALGIDLMAMATGLVSLDVIDGENGQSTDGGEP